MKTPSGFLWANEGFTHFTELLRMQHTSLEEVLDAYLSELVKYLKANQGAVFLVNQDSAPVVLQLSACYAYGRKKTLTNRSALGRV